MQGQKTMCTLQLHVKWDVTVVSSALLLVLGSSLFLPPLSQEFCSAVEVPFSKGKGEDQGGTMPERSDPVISLPALYNAGHCLPQPPPQLFGGHRVSCALASLLWPWLVLAMWFLLPGQMMNEGEHFPGHLSWVNRYSAVFILQDLMRCVLFSLADSSKHTNNTAFICPGLDPAQSLVLA